MMNKKRRYCLITVGMLSVVLIVTAFTGRKGVLVEHGKAKVFAPVTNTTYKNECGSCHMAYQPGLLPSNSWSRVLGELPSHFKREVVLTPKTLDSITSYLKDNAAENSDAVRAKKILQSITGDLPLRISAVPYIQEKHRCIANAVFSQKSVRFRGNCSACHKTAQDGNYSDDNVKIPK